MLGTEVDLNDWSGLPTHIWNGLDRFFYKIDVFSKRLSPC